MDYRLWNSSVFLLHQANRRLAARFENSTGGELTAPQFLLLTSLSRLGATNQIELVRTSGIDRSTVSVMLRQLAKRGLVRLRIDRRDTRAHKVVLTEAGLDVVKRGLLVEKALSGEIATQADEHQHVIAALAAICRQEKS